MCIVCVCACACACVCVCGYLLTIVMYMHYVHVCVQQKVPPTHLCKYVSDNFLDSIGFSHVISVIQLV